MEKLFFIKMDRNNFEIWRRKEFVIKISFQSKHVFKQGKSRSKSMKLLASCKAREKSRNLRTLAAAGLNAQPKFIPFLCVDELVQYMLMLLSKFFIRLVMNTIKSEHWHKSELGPQVVEAIYGKQVQHLKSN